MNTPDIIYRHELVEAGFSQREIDCAIHTGRLARIGRGVFATPHADPRHIEIAKRGASLGCVSACKLHGLWTPYDNLMHLNISSKRRIPWMSHAIFHRIRVNQRTFVAPVADAVAQVIKHHDVESALIVAESAVYKQILTADHVRSLIEQYAPKKYHSYRFFTPGAESGSETRVRLFFQMRGVPVKIQVVIRGIGRVDLFVGNCMIVECDSHGYHRSREQQHRDRLRDAEAHKQGYFVVRLSFDQIWYEWENTKKYLSALLAARVHRKMLLPL